jgi:hypothetical protein
VLNLSKGYQGWAASGLAVEHPDPAGSVG